MRFFIHGLTLSFTVGHYVSKGQLWEIWLVRGICVCSGNRLVSPLDFETSLKPIWLPAEDWGHKMLSGQPCSLSSQSHPSGSGASALQHSEVPLVTSQTLSVSEVRSNPVAISPPAGRLFHVRLNLHVIDLLAVRGIISRAGLCQDLPLRCLLSSPLGMNV